MKLVIPVVRPIAIDLGNSLHFLSFKRLVTGVSRF